jgi:hypothetical protein
MKRFVSKLLLLAFFALGPSGRQNSSAMDIPVQESDVIFNVGLGPTTGGIGTPCDFDGDGYDDVLWSKGESGVFAFMGGSLPKNSDFDESRNWQMDKSGYNGCINDVNGDGRRELQFQSGILFGREGLPESWNLGPAGIDVETIGSMNALGISDVTGDGFSDFVRQGSMGGAYRGSVDVVHGRSEWPTQINWTTFPPLQTIYGAKDHDQLGSRGVFISDFNNDGRMDMAIPARSGTYIVLGSSVMPVIRDLGTPDQRADCWISSAVFTVAAGDINGDGYGDLAVALDNNYSFLSGMDISNHPEIDLTPGSPTHRPTVPVHGLSEFVLADFDGDGRSDFIGRVNNSPGILHIILSSAYTSWPSFPPSIEGPHVRITSNLNLVLNGIGDFNNDGYDDLLLHETWGKIYVVYGFRPLTRPNIQIGKVSPHSTRVSVTLSVEGDPTDMRFSGHIVDSFRDHWIPYETAATLTLSPPAENKSVSVQFRNGFGRTSESVTETVVLMVEGNQAEVGTNLVSDGQRARVEYEMTAPGHLKVAVYTRMGQKLITLIDDERAAGIWPAEWDGTNQEGRRVAPGIYLWIAEWGDQKARTKVLVQ